MPPKARFTKQMIEDAAFELAKQRGMEAVAAREVAKALNMTVTPIFGCFTNMAELKQTVYVRAKAEFQTYLRGCKDYTPAFHEFCLRWVHYAAENPNLYRLLMQKVDSPERIRELIPDIAEFMLEEITALFDVSRSAAADLMEYLLVYISGLSALRMHGAEVLTEEAISRKLGNLYISLLSTRRVLDGQPPFADLPELRRVAEEGPKQKC